MVVVVVVVVSCMFCMDFLNKSTTCLHFRTSCPLWMYHQGFHSEQSDERERAVKWWASSMYMDNVVSSVAFRNVFVGPHFWQIWWRIFCGEGVWVGQLMRSCLLGLRRSGNVGVPLTLAWVCPSSASLAFDLCFGRVQVGHYISCFCFVWAAHGKPFSQLYD
jgi:hypothetical protein